jgi:hypothetical protein
MVAVQVAEMATETLWMPRKGVNATGFRPRLSVVAIADRATCGGRVVDEVETDEKTTEVRLLVETDEKATVISGEATGVQSQMVAADYSDVDFLEVGTGAKAAEQGHEVPDVQEEEEESGREQIGMVTPPAGYEYSEQEINLNEVGTEVSARQRNGEGQDQPDVTETEEARGISQDQAEVSKEAGDGTPESELREEPEAVTQPPGETSEGAEASDVTQKVAVGYRRHEYSDNDVDLDDIGTAVGCQQRIDIRDHDEPTDTAEVVQGSVVEPEDAVEMAQESVVGIQLPDQESAAATLDVADDPVTVSKDDAGDSAVPEGDSLASFSRERRQHGHSDDAADQSCEYEYYYEYDDEVSTATAASLRRLISVMNYDRDRPCAFTEPATLEALDQLGIESPELFLPTRAELAKYPADPEARRVVDDHFTRRIDRLVALVREKRSEILSAPSDSSGADVSPEAAIVWIERKRLERVREFQRREAQILVCKVYETEIAQEQQRVRDEREAQRLQKLREDREQFQRVLHRRHLARLRELEQQDLRRRRVEEEKQRQQTERAREQREKEARRLRMHQEELYRISHAAQSELKRREGLIQKVKNQQQLDDEERRQQNEQFERDQVERDAEHRAKIELGQKTKAQRERDKLARASEVRREVEGRQNEGRSQLVTADQGMRQKVARIRKQQEIASERARNLQSDAALKSQRRLEQFRASEEKEKQAVDEEFAKREAISEKLREDQQRQVMLRNLTNRLKQDELNANAKHLQNQRTRQIRLMKEKQQEDEARLRKQKQEQHRIQAERATAVAELETERATFQAELRSNARKVSESTLKRVAQRFNMDLNELRKKVEGKLKSRVTPVTAATPLPLIRPQLQEAPSS